MQMQFTPNNKLASLGTIGLLFLAGIAGMVFLLPYNTAHAAGPTVTLSTLTITTGGVLTAVTSTTVGTTLTIEGFGFAPATPITITTAVGSTTVPWLTQGSCTTTNGGTSGSTTPASLISGGCLITTAVGNFAIEANVPNLPNGVNTVTVSDGTSSATATLTINAAVSISYTAVGAFKSLGFPGQSVNPTITVTGFGSGEAVSGSTTAFTAASSAYGCTTGSSVGTYGTCTLYSAVTTISDVTGGSKTFTATGATTGATATASITVNPWVAFYNSANDITTFSFIGTAPTSILVEGHGMPAGTIAGNSITVGGIATNHAAVTVGSAGNFYALVVSPTTNVPFGPVSVVIGGTTYNYAAGNIALGTFGNWGGVLISSIAGSGTSTGVATTDASSYKPGGVTASTTSTKPAQDQIGFFGYGFVTNGGGGGTVAIATPSGATFCTTAPATTCGVSPAFQAGNGVSTTHVDANGAIFATTFLGDTPWSTSSAPTVAASYTATVSQGATAPANILSPSFGITDWIGTITPTSVDYQSTQTVAVHGFGATDAITVTIGGASMVSGGTCTTTNGACTTASGQVPDIAGGKQNVAATGSITGQVMTSTGAVTYSPIVGPTAGGQALSINTGGAGQTTVLRTGTNYGVHGLLANDGYQIVWNPIGGSVTIGTFTATATGGVPIPGVQVTIPADSSGIHIIDIQNTGSYALFGSTFGGNFVPTEAPFSSTYTTAFGDMLFKNVALLQASPSVATVGSPETLSGNGLAAGGSYVMALGSGAGTVSTSAPALGVFTATGTGSVPSGTSITLADTATTLETGTLEYLSVQTAAHFGTTTSSDAYAQFVLAANANLNMTSAPDSHPVTISAHALNTGGVYAIVFGYVESPFSTTSYTGTTVGVLAPNAVGAGSASFNVPSSAASGTYIVQLVVSSAGTGGAAVGTGILDTPATLTVGSVATSCNTTACLGATGSPTVTQIGSNKAVQTTYTNNSNAPATAIVYAVVHNSLGQTVSYSTATITMNAGASATAYDVLFGLAPGTYTVTIFATSTSGTAISGTSTATVTI